MAEMSMKIRTYTELSKLCTFHERYEYLTEINRLLMVRAELTRRIKEDEGILIVLIAMKRRRLRAV